MTITDKRKEKKHFGLTSPAYHNYQARLMGETAGYEALRYSRKTSNPYPLGIRHQQWQDGHDLADPMGDHHGENR